MSIDVQDFLEGEIPIQLGASPIADCVIDLHEMTAREIGARFAGWWLPETPLPPPMHVVLEPHSPNTRPRVLVFAHTLIQPTVGVDLDEAMRWAICAYVWQFEESGWITSAVKARTKARQCGVSVSATAPFYECTTMSFSLEHRISQLLKERQEAT